MLVSPGRFLAATGHEALLDAWGTNGIAEAVALVRGGAGTAPALAAALIPRSGLDELTRVLETRIGDRAAALRMRGALRELRGRPAAIPHSSPGSTARWRTTTPSSSSARSAPCPRSRRSPRPTRAALDRVLGGTGTRPTARLGLPAGTPAGKMHAAALRAAVHWRRRLDDPVLDPAA
ncbi:hypothetical protein GCM10010472_65080 [Pseudonocardia halophobica]